MNDVAVGAPLNVYGPGGAQTWEKVIRKVRAGMMPPAGMPRPIMARLNTEIARILGDADTKARCRDQPRVQAEYDAKRG